MPKGISIQRPSVQRPSTIIIASRRDSTTPVQARQKASKFRVFLSRIISWLTADPLERIRTLNTSTRDVQGEHHTIDLRDSRLPNVVPSRTSFDPRALRKPASPIKPWMAFTNLVRTVFGVGFLALPLAFSQVGYVLGITFMIFTGILLIHGHLCLLWCLNEVSKQLRVPYVNYRYGFRLTLLHGPECFANLGEYGPAVVAIVMILSQIGICSVFVGFTADCLKDMADLDSTGTALVYLLLPYLLMSLLMKDLRIISYVSALGNISDLFGLGLMLVQIFSDPHGKMVPIIARPLPMLVAFGTMLFNMSSTGVILMIDRSLRDPTVLLGKYGFISLITVIATIAGTVFSILSYWSFGTIDGNVLRSLPFDFSLSIWTISLFFVSITFTYPLQSYPGLYVLMQLIRDRNVDVQATDEFMKILEIVTRPCFVLVSFLIIYLVPFQSALVAFVGNMCTTLLAIVFPAYMELCLRYPDNYGFLKFHLLKNLFLIIVAFVTWVLGIVMTGYLIYIRVLAMSSPTETDLFD